MASPPSWLPPKLVMAQPQTTSFLEFQILQPRFAVTAEHDLPAGDPIAVCVLSVPHLKLLAGPAGHAAALESPRAVRCWFPSPALQHSSEQ
ncbi:unnamed protein product [Urochloa humidicola]